MITYFDLFKSSSGGVYLKKKEKREGSLCDTQYCETYCLHSFCLFGDMTWYRHVKMTFTDRNKLLFVTALSKVRSAPVQTGPGADPASYTKSAWSFPGVKRPGRGVDHLLPPKLKKRVELYTHSSSGPSWPVIG